MTVFRREAASAYVWALVSGFPGERRRRRQLLMLQAHIDDSKSDGKLFVLAGYIAPAEAWAAFSDEWQAELDRSPPFDEFKMKAMNYLQAWERCGRFYSIIEKHVVAAVSVAIPLEDFANAVRGTIWPPGMENHQVIHTPYWWAFQCIITGLARHQSKLGLIEPIDFIFDEQSERAHFRGTWDDYKNRAPDSERRMMGDPPIFRKSHDLPPLQAADLYAWWVRRWIIDGVADGLEKLAFKWPVTKSIPRLSVTYDEPELRKQFLSLRENVWNIFAAKNLHISPWTCSRPRWDHQRLDA